MKSYISALLVPTFMLPLGALAKAQPAQINCGKVSGYQSEAETELVDNVNMVNVTFIGKKPGNQQIDKALRECLDVAIRRDASKDILPSAWIRKKPGASKYDDDLLHPFGSLRFLSYTAATKKIEVRELQLKKR